MESIIFDSLKYLLKQYISLLNLGFHSDNIQFLFKKLNVEAYNQTCVFESGQLLKRLCIKCYLS